MSRMTLPALALALLFPLTGSALQELPVVVFSGINFAVAGAGTIGYPSGCNFMFLDANGAVVSDGRFSVYGAFNCVAENEAYPVSGSGYLTDEGTVSLGLYVGTALWSCSLSSTTLSGSCAVVNNGSPLGTLQLTFTP